MTIEPTSRAATLRRRKTWRGLKLPHAILPPLSGNLAAMPLPSETAAKVTNVQCHGCGRMYPDKRELGRHVARRGCETGGSKND